MVHKYDNIINRSYANIEPTLDSSVGSNDDGVS